ncbi:MAG: hypothetical protein P1V36_08220, partial [Planctomycetota bacterium]|nr:hypothetical protein [Planctomycetota bacterium]
LGDAAARATMGRPRLLFGDGHASERIAAHLAGAQPAPWTPDAHAPAGA